jgi:hypothetical protein
VDTGPKFDMNVVVPFDVLEAAGSWWIRQPVEVHEAWKDRLGAALPERLLAMYESWLDRWEEERKHERPLGVEVYWERPLPRPESDAEWGGSPVDMPPMILLGYVDEVYEDTQRGNMVVVRDGKTSKSLQAASAVDDMMDSQLHLYAWGLSPWLAEHEKTQARAVGYDRIRSIGPKPPTLTTTGRLAARGGEPSINGTDLKTYLEWAAGPDGNGVPWQGAMLPQTAAEKAADPQEPRRYKPGGLYQAEPDVIARLSHGTRARRSPSPATSCGRICAPRWTRLRTSGAPVSAPRPPARARGT